MTTRGHNERSFRLDALADEARKGLAQVSEGEEFSINGWLAYGYALNEGRSLFPGNREFGEWVRSANLAEWNGQPVHDHDRAAAMWAAANADQFEEARQRGNPRTIRGIHAKWKEIEAERESQARADAEKKAREEAAEKIPSERTNREDGATGREGYTPDGSSRLPSGRTDGPSDAGETVAEGDEPAAGGSPAPAPDPYRKGLSGLSREGLEDECVGLRAEVADLRASLDAVRAERDDLAARLKDASEEGQGAVIGRLHRQVATLKGARDDALARAAKETRRANFISKERDELRDSIQRQEVRL